MQIADIHSLMAALADERPIFHSEADFQHAFAWEMHRRWPQARIRLEQVLRAGDQRMKVDITVYGMGQPVAIELKYPKNTFSATIDEEIYRLNYGVTDNSLFDYVYDIRRLESLSVQLGFSGFAVLLTNDQAHWTLSETVGGAAYRLIEGRVLEGTLAWRDGTNLSYLASRAAAQVLTGRYSIEWREYSNVQGEGRGEFRYLALHVPAAGGE